MALSGDRGRPWADRTLWPCLAVWLFLRAQPNPVFEGDTLTLQCQGRKNAALSHVNFYKDGQVLHLPQNSRPLLAGTATASSSGKYSCSAKMTFMLWTGRVVSETSTVQVQGASPAGGRGASEQHPHSGCMSVALSTHLHPRGPAGWGTKCPEPALLLTPTGTLGRTLPLWGPDDPFWGHPRWPSGIPGTRTVWASSQSQVRGQRRCPPQPPGASVLNP